MAYRKVLGGFGRSLRDGVRHTVYEAAAKRVIEKGNSRNLTPQDLCNAMYRMLGNSQFDVEEVGWNLVGGNKTQSTNGHISDGNCYRLTDLNKTCVQRNDLRILLAAESGMLSAAILFLNFLGHQAAKYQVITEEVRKVGCFGCL